MKTNLYQPIEQECIVALRKARPDVAITVSREIDRYAVWNEAEWGGPHPDHLTAYEFTVEACAIRDGVMYRAEACLSESWCAPNEDVSDMHGYLPQKVVEAVAELDKLLEGRHE